jgi:hypothetical protein
MWDLQFGSPFRANSEWGEFPRVNLGLCFLDHFGPRMGTAKLLRALLRLNTYLDNLGASFLAPFGEPSSHLTDVKQIPSTSRLCRIFQLVSLNDFPSVGFPKEDQERSHPAANSIQVLPESGTWSEARVVNPATEKVDSRSSSKSLNPVPPVLKMQYRDPLGDSQNCLARRDSLPVS